jgi:kinesin family protein C1
LEVLTIEHVAASAQLNAVCADLAATKARAEATLEAKEKEHKKEVERLQFDLSVLKSRASKIYQNASKERPEEEDEAILKARIEERDRRIAELEADLLRGEELRRQMHNRLQELRGNVRVFVRTRPFLPNDKQHNDPAIDVSPDGESLSILDARSNSRHSFKFDKVFPPSSGQDLIFQEVADFVQSALDGYQVCLFSYGQTGSGKTHTMQGSGNAVMRGIIPRAVEQILMQAKVMQKQRWDFKLSASFLEIYNEELKDLLTVMSQENSISSKLAIKRGIDGKSYVEGLTEVPIETVNSEEGMTQLEALMSVAARARSVASTNMNAHSSRSHSVFQLHIHGYNHESQAEVQGSLNLCDLAGSERLDRSGANNDAKRLKETQAINKSLSSLGDVFTALAQRASHIPFRNSKLTYLLQDCLSGDGKALMFVNLSPTTASSSESLCSLRFAQRVNQVELGKPTKNIQYKR